MTNDRKSADEYAEMREEFALWLALPKHERKPKTQKEFARAHDIRDATLSGWKALPQFAEIVTKNSIAVASSMLGRVLHSIAGHAMKGDDANARLFLEALGLVRSPGSASATIVVGAGGLEGLEREQALAERDSILARRGGSSDASDRNGGDAS